MKLSHAAPALALAAGAQALSYAAHEDDDGIAFYRASFDVADEVAQWGMALPAASQTDYASEYIGNIVAPIGEDAWFAMVHATGMTNALILLTFLDGETIRTSFRYAAGYVAPDIYTGNATLTPISQSVNATHYELTYRCENCWVWDQDGAGGDQIPATTASAGQIMGWAHATAAVTDVTDEESAIKQHQDSGLMGVDVGKARNSAYTKWISLATATGAAPSATGTKGSGSGAGSGSSATKTAMATSTKTPVATAAPCPASNPATNQTWDYIVVGAGAGGIPLADKLSEDGSSVLLVERGPPSSGRWGGDMKPEWLEGTNLTRFDVPGLDNQIWADSEGIACTDYSVMAGCVLGGGTAVNAGLWWRANPSDFDVNFPAGWQASDMEAAIDRAFERIPSTVRPSVDGKLYKPQGYEIVAGAMAASGWENVTANDSPAAKNFTFSHPEHMFNGGERGGPMATYLVTASERENFKLVHSTDVNRVLRTGGKITGVEMQAHLKGGQCGVAKVKPTGKVILAAGAFGSPKILFRSGIGPADQLEVVKGAEGSKMIKERDWINLPVGENLDDHTNTDIVIEHPDVQFYDFYKAYDKPIKADMNKYLDARSGILAQSAPNLAAMMWQEIEGDDGVVRQIQWNARVEGSHDVTSKKAMTISQYLGRGKTSRGKASINGALNMVVSKMPYLNNKHDIAAVAAGIDSLKEMLAADPNIKVVYPPQNQTTMEFLDAYPVTTGSRSANHWMGSCKMGLDSGLTADGTSVVDLNAKVYGTDNLFVVDASIFPGMVSTNPSALIVAVAEHAAPLIAKVKVSAAASPTSAGTAIATGTGGFATGTASGTGYSVLPSGTGVYGNATKPCTQTLTRSSSLPAGTAVPSGIMPSGSTGYPMPTGTGGGVYGNATTTTPCTQTLTRTKRPSATVVDPVATSTGGAEAGASAGFPSHLSSSSTAAAGTAPPKPSSSSTKCVKTLTRTSAAATSTAAPAAPPAAPPAGGSGSGSGAIGEWQQCGGSGFAGAKGCGAGLTCKAWNEWYSQCVKA